MGQEVHLCNTRQSMMEKLQNHQFGLRTVQANLIFVAPFWLQQVLQLLLTTKVPMYHSLLMLPCADEFEVETFICTGGLSSSMQCMLAVDVDMSSKGVDLARLA